MTKQVEINGKNYNTYATVEDADNYFNATFGSEWSNIGAVQKPQLLVTATRLIDRKNYIGKKVEENQPLKFPRVFFNEELSDDNLVMETCMELALNIYSDGGKDVDITNVNSVKLGDSSITFKENANIASDDDLLIEEYLGKYLMSGVRVIL